MDWESRQTIRSRCVRRELHVTEGIPHHQHLSVWKRDLPSPALMDDRRGGHTKVPDGSGGGGVVEQCQKFEAQGSTLAAANRELQYPNRIENSDWLLVKLTQVQYSDHIP
ncbi:hypothetical protein O3P69_013660 [Scylla paramamosain]|uniref:Uncharacterized protein n=1 Tax=Scylla paramamosain TaxID=85552 RepID=A0AAW0SQW9_SCYPA